MWPVQKVKVHPTVYEWGKKKGEKLGISYFLKVHRLSHHCSCGDSTWILAAHALLAPVSSFVDSHEWCVSRVVVGVHKLTSRTSVGVLDWSCCSLALLPALIPVSCRYCWPCCRLAASTRSICSWHALKQSWNEKGQMSLHIRTLQLHLCLNASQTGWACTHQPNKTSRVQVHFG